jgi:eukaryotic-like serine/threonine-protein kinase
VGTSVHLWIADTLSDKVTGLTSGITSEVTPDVSPDGKTIAFTEGMSDYDVVSVSVRTAAVQPFIATSRDETMPSWAAHSDKTVFVTDRNGPTEIWLRAGDGTLRPLVGARDFPSTSSAWLMTPMLSPDGERVIYARVDGQASAQLWMSAVSGGLPVRLTNSEKDGEFSGSWSPDGSWFAYGTSLDGKYSLKKVKTSGQATPVLLKPRGGLGIVSWSRTGDWIAYGDEENWNLISPDGKNEKVLGKFDTPYLEFSNDGKRLFGMREGGGKVTLFSVDAGSGAVTDIGQMEIGFAPRSSLNPGVHFSLSPDGETLVYGTQRYSSNLWLLKGFDQKMGLLERLGLRR